MTKLQVLMGVGYFVEIFIAGKDPVAKYFGPTKDLFSMAVIKAFGLTVLCANLLMGYALVGLGIDPVICQQLYAVSKATAFGLIYYQCKVGSAVATEGLYVQGINTVVSTYLGFF